MRSLVELKVNQRLTLHSAVKTLKTNFSGVRSLVRSARQTLILRQTLNMLGLAKRVKARFLLASTSGALAVGSYCHQAHILCRDLRVTN